VTNTEPLCVQLLNKVRKVSALVVSRTCFLNENTWSRCVANQVLFYYIVGI
jgi:hypothetical protein